MEKLYKKKGKTQGHLREIMVEEYKTCKNSVLVAEKFKVSPKTVLKWVNAENLVDKNSAPKIPARKYELSSLCLIYWLYEKDNLKGDEILDHFEDNNLEMKRSSIYYYLKIWGLTKRKKDAKKRINQQFKDYDPGFLHVDITY
jgi:transposase